MVSGFLEIFQKPPGGANHFCLFWVSEEKLPCSELPTARQRVLESPVSGFWLSCPAVMYTRQATRVTLGQFLCFSGFWGKSDRRERQRNRLNDVGMVNHVRIYSINGKIG